MGETRNWTTKEAREEGRKGEGGREREPRRGSETEKGTDNGVGWE